MKDRQNEGIGHKVNALLLNILGGQPTPEFKNPLVADTYHSLLQILLEVDTLYSAVQHKVYALAHTRERLKYAGKTFSGELATHNVTEDEAKAFSRRLNRIELDMYEAIIDYAESKTAQ